MFRTSDIILNKHGSSQDYCHLSGFSTFKPATHGDENILKDQSERNRYVNVNNFFSQPLPGITPLHPESNFVITSDAGDLFHWKTCNNYVECPLSDKASYSYCASL